jgi:hypothetical protein
MPMYAYRCPLGCSLDVFLTVKQHGRLNYCDRHGYVMEQVIGAPLLVKVQPECRYDSPITGEPVTTWAARQDDLKRHDCIPYDPLMKQDHERRLAEQEARLEQAVDEDVEAAIEKMPTAKRAKLYSEMVEQGMDTELVRSTKGA